VNTNTPFWNSLNIQSSGAFYVAIPYWNSASQTGTSTGTYITSSTGNAYPLWSAIRKRNWLPQIPDSFTTNITFQIQRRQEIVVGLGASLPYQTGWYNHILTNRMEQIGANDWVNLDGQNGLGLTRATTNDIPGTDPLQTFTQSIVYTSQEYQDFYAPFFSMTGAKVLPSDASVYAASSSASTSLAALPQPERVIYPTTINPTVYNNVSYSQMAEAILYLQSIGTAFGSLTISNILTAYRNLFVANPSKYLPLFDREYNVIVANPSWVYLSTPLNATNRSLAYLIYYGA
jgi:hypothetical protein